MQKSYRYSVWTAIGVLAIAALACGLSVDLGASPTATATQAPLQPPVIVPTPVSSATSVPEPTAVSTAASFPEPLITATDVNDQYIADAADYFRRGFLPFEGGQLSVLEDFSKKGSSLDLLDLTPTRRQVQDFALWADIMLNTTGSTTYPNYTGCGFAYRVQNANEGYTAILTNEAVRMGACSSGMKQCTLFGTTHGFGTGLVDVPNGSTAQFSLAVNKDHAWVLVNGVLVGQYTLYTTKLLGMGDLYYSAVSNINAGYRTACQIANVRVWESRP